MAKAPISSGPAKNVDATKRALVAALEADPLDFCTYNKAQHRFFAVVKNPRPNSLTLAAFLKGNGTGGTRSVISVLSAIMFGSDNPLFEGVPFGVMWPYQKKSARIVSQGDLLSDKGPIQQLIRELFPVARYKQTKGVGKPYFAEGETDTGWDWDVRTYDQTPQQCSGGNKDLIIFIEPPPYDVFIECCTRLRGNGLVLIDMTQMDLADWAEDLADKGKLILGGKDVGDVRIARGEPHDACVDCYPPDPEDPTKPHGHRRHSEIEADEALWPIEEREARKSGRPLSRSGRIYQNWSERNELDELPSEWHKKTWERGIARCWCVANPHDRMAWPIFWGATFPNDDVVIFAEWPNFAWHECKSSPITHYDDMRWVIIEAEKQMPPIVDRIMDPLFGETIKQTGFNLFQKLRGPCLKCKPETPIRDSAHDAEAARLDDRCEHSLDFRHGVAYPGSVNAGHILVRAAIGDPIKNTRPKLYAMKAACPNFCYMSRRYGWKENRSKEKGASSTPQLVLKEPADCIRLVYLSHLEKYPEEVKPLEFYSPPQRGVGSTSIG